eukprot:scaffold7640_cov153-Isochrysis_galbana.AAC.2
MESELESERERGSVVDQWWQSGSGNSQRGTPSSSQLAISNYSAVELGDQQIQKKKGVLFKFPRNLDLNKDIHRYILAYS